MMRASEQEQKGKLYMYRQRERETEREKEREKRAAAAGENLQAEMDTSCWGKTEQEERVKLGGRRVEVKHSKCVESDSNFCRWST